MGPGKSGFERANVTVQRVHGLSIGDVWGSENGALKPAFCDRAICTAVNRSVWPG
jgi:hypothetical protein